MIEDSDTIWLGIAGAGIAAITLAAFASPAFAQDSDPTEDEVAAAKAAAELDLKSGLDLELDLFALLVPMEDVKEAALAFKEKRAPQFVGR